MLQRRCWRARDTEGPGGITTVTGDGVGSGSADDGGRGTASSGKGSSAGGPVPPGRIGMGTASPGVPVPVPTCAAKTTGGSPGTTSVGTTGQRATAMGDMPYVGDKGSTGVVGDSCVGTATLARRRSRVRYCASMSAMLTSLPTAILARRRSASP